MCYDGHMSPSAIEILTSALKLPDSDRAALAAQLIESLDQSRDAGAEKAWEAEIARRLVELDSGKVKPVPWAQARAMILGTADGSATS